MHKTLKLATWLILVSGIGLTGCATKKELYSWGPYEPQVYAYFKDEGTVDKQIGVLEKHLAETTAKGRTPPPGFYAHLGLLYTKTGKSAEALAMFEQEQKLYPESAVFIKNLNNQFKVAPQ